MPPAARITDSHGCPVKGHSENPIVTGQPNVMICGQPAARISDTTSCKATIVSGEASVIIGGMPAARKGDFTNHGGYIVSGCSSVLIGKPAPADCLKTDKPLAKDQSPTTDPPGPDSVPPSSPPTAEPPSLLEQIRQAIKDTPLKPLSEAILKGEDVFSQIGGLETLDLVNRSLNVVNMVYSAMGKENPLGKITGALNLLSPDNNALTQVGGLLTLLGEDKAGGALSFFGGVVGKGQPLPLLASATRLTGEDKMASILTLGSGNTRNVIHDVNSIMGGEGPKPTSSTPQSTPLNPSQISNQGSPSTEGSSNKISHSDQNDHASPSLQKNPSTDGSSSETHHSLTDQEYHVSPSLAPHSDHNPFV